MNIKYFGSQYIPQVNRSDFNIESGINIKYIFYNLYQQIDQNLYPKGWEKQNELISVSNIDIEINEYVLSIITNVISDIILLLYSNLNSNAHSSDIKDFSDKLNTLLTDFDTNNVTFNIEQIPNIKNLLYTIIILTIKPKYISLILSLEDIVFNEDLLTRNIFINSDDKPKNILLLSIIIPEISQYIINNIGTLTYNEYLLKNNDNNNNLNLIEFAMYKQRLFDLIPFLNIESLQNIKFFNSNNFVHLLILSMGSAYDAYNNHKIDKDNRINKYVNNHNLLLNINNYEFIKKMLYEPNIFNKIPLQLFSNSSKGILPLLEL